MNLYLVRHADALPIGSEGVLSDADRPLSPEGRRQIAELAAWWKRAGVLCDQILTSPLVRARQSAEELQQQLQIPATALTLCDYLRPGESSKKLARFLRELNAEHVMLVGHEPDLSRHAAWLIGSKKARLEFAKSGAACIACDEPPRKEAGVLTWLVTRQCLAK